MHPRFPFGEALPSVHHQQVSGRSVRHARRAATLTSTVVIRTHYSSNALHTSRDSHPFHRFGTGGHDGEEREAAEVELLNAELPDNQAPFLLPPLPPLFSACIK